MSNLRDKKCNRCKCWRKEEDFISNERVVKSCIKCRNIQKKYVDKYREENKEKIAEYQKQHYQEHKQEKAEYQKKYNEENKEKIAEYQKQHYQEYKQELTEYQKKYNEEHKQEKAEYHKKYNEEHKQEKAEYHKKYKEEHKEELTQYKKQHYNKHKQENPLHIKFRNMINSSKTADKKSNRTYNEEEYITEDFLNELWVKQNEKCFYENCECKLTLEFNTHFRNPNQITIQRLNNDIAHIKDNCVLSCYKCNVSHIEDADFYKKMIERANQYQ